MRGIPTDGPLHGRTLLAVFAHPDDESLACGGTLARCADAGARVFVLCATRGEAGDVSDPALLGGNQLARVRENELREAAGVLGLTDVMVLGHPDGCLPWVEPGLLQAEIRVAIRHYRPDVVITFGEDGLYWHPDHIAVYEQTTAAVASLGTAAPALYYATMPSGSMDAAVTAAQAISNADFSDGVCGIAPEAFGAEANPPTLIIDVQPYALRKLAALRCHRTQMGPLNPLSVIADGDAPRVLGVEHFHRPADLPHLETFLDLLAGDAHQVQVRAGMK